MRSQTFNPRDLELGKEPCDRVAAVIDSYRVVSTEAARRFEVDCAREFAAAVARGESIEFGFGDRAQPPLFALGQRPFLRVVEGVPRGVARVAMPQSSLRERDLRAIGVDLVFHLAAVFVACGVLADTESATLVRRAHSLGATP